MSNYPRIFVTQLSRDVDESALFALFAQHVSVHAAKVVRTPEGRSLNYGFVELASHDENDIASALELDGYWFHDRQLVVKRAREK